MGIFSKRKTRKTIGHVESYVAKQMAINASRSENFADRFNISEDDYDTFHIEYMMLSVFTFTMVAEHVLGSTEREHVLSIFHGMVEGHYKDSIMSINRRDKKEYYDYFIDKIGSHLVEYTKLFKYIDESDDFASVIGERFAKYCEQENNTAYIDAGKSIFDSSVSLALKGLEKHKGHLLDIV